MSKKLIIVADDFGLSKGINNGIIRSYTEGFVTEISLMIDAYETDDAISQIKKNKIEDIGLHMMLVGTSSGKLLRKNDYVELFMNKSSEEVAKLALAELKLFEKKVGSKPTHICPQNGIHGNLKLLNTVIEFAEEHDIAVRIPDIALDNPQPDKNYAAEIMLKRSSVRHTDILLSHVLGYNLTKIAGYFTEELSRITKNESIEIVLHPGYLTSELIGKTSLLFERSRDLIFSLDDSLLSVFDNMGFDLIPYRKL